MQILTLLLLGLAALVACQPIEKTTKSVVSYTYGPHHHQGPPVESATLAGRSVEDKHDDEPGDDPPNGHPHDDNDDTASSLAPRDDAAVHSSLDPSADPSLGSLLDLYHGSDITINLDTLVKSECHYEHRGALFKLNYGRTEVCTAEWYSSGKEAEAKPAPTPKATAKPSLGPLSASSLSTPPGSSADPSAWSVAGDTVRAVLMALRTPNVTSGLTISARRIVEHQCRIGPFGLQKCELTWEKQHYPVLEPPPAAKEPSSKANDKTGASLAPRDDEPLRNPLPVPVDVPVDSLSSDPPAGTVDDNDYPGHDITIDEDQIVRRKCRSSMKDPISARQCATTSTTSSIRRRP